MSSSHTQETNLPHKNPPLPQKQITINQHTYTVEIASTPQEQQLGLQNRPELTPRQGMLFIFQDSQIRNFWMKDTLYPLDIIYLDSNLIITQIFPNTPTCQSQDPSQLNCPHYVSKAASQYVLELKAGQTQKDRLQIGDKLTLP